MKKFYVIAVLIMALWGQYASAQDRVITGTVVDAIDSQPIIGATVVVPGSTIGTVTDLDGKYSLKVPQSYKAILISFIGYKPFKVELGATTVIDVELEEDVIGLEQVVVTAIGIAKDKKALGYSVQEVQGDDLTRGGDVNLVSALSGKVAGVQITQSSGLPGASSHIRIRGSNSFTWSSNNQPLFVIDGVPMSNDYKEAGNPGNLQNNFLDGVDVSNRAIDINPADIASMSVLKGPAAAALYGLRASNGAVIITTKSGKESGKRFRIDINTGVSFQEANILPDVQQKFSQGSNGNYGPGSSLSWGALVDTLRLDSEGRIVGQSNPTATSIPVPIFDNITPFFQTGHTIKNSVSISGNSDIADYYLSYSNLNQDGILPNSSFDRNTIKMSGKLKINEKLSFGSSVNYVSSGGDRIQKGSNLSNPLFTVYPAPITYDLHGLPYAREDDPYAQLHYRSAFDNPLWATENNSFTDRVDRIFGNMSVDFLPLDWLTISYKLGTDVYTDRRKSVLELGSGETGGRGTNPPSGGQIYEDTHINREVNSDLLIKANRTFGEKLDVSVVIGNNINDQYYNRVYTEGNGFSIGGFHNISNTSTVATTEQTNRKRIIGLFGDVQLAYNRTLYLGLTGRNDWSSTLPASNPSFFYPAVNLGWVFTETLGLTDNAVLPYGKLRASWAQVGQDAPIYSTQTTYVSSAPGSGFTSDGIVFPQNGVNAFEFGNVIGNPEIKPQNETSYELGADLRFFRNRLGLDITYYDAVAKDQIFSVPVSATSGARSLILNAGEITNKGVELVLTATPIETKVFSWDITFNYSKNESKVVKLAEGVDAITIGGFTAPQVRLVQGQPYATLWGSRYLRDDNGNIVYDDANPNSASYGMPLQDPNTGIIGNTQPNWIGGMINTFMYKNFSLTIQFDTRQGGQIYAGNTRLLRLYGMTKETENRGDRTVLPGVKGHLDQSGNLIVGGVNDIEITTGEAYWRVYQDAIDESNVFDGSFVRLREVTLAYRLGSQLLKKTPFSGLEIYFSGQNLALFTDYPNFDPETSLGGASNLQGFEYLSMPNARSLGGGLKISF
ncbi:MAG: SusC/RagA family TonB-linked outer membrane protein [Chitinophagales bacterium]